MVDSRMRYVRTGSSSFNAFLNVIMIFYVFGGIAMYLGKMKFACGFIVTHKYHFHLRVTITVEERQLVATEMLNA